MQLLLATNNPNKVWEAQAIIAHTGLKLTSLAELRLIYEPTETGDTFEENAIQKATKTLAFLKESGHDGYTVIADDSGLVVNAMDGLPGVDSANYMGRETPYAIRNAHIIKLCEGAADRSAYFACVIACAFPNGEVITTEAKIHGEIAREIKGENGFGYDPIFYVPEYGKTTAELSNEEKNKISHRGQAIAQMLQKLKM